MPQLPDDHPFVVAYRRQHGRHAPCELSEETIAEVTRATSEGEDWSAWTFYPATEAEEELEWLEREEDEDD